MLQSVEYMWFASTTLCFTTNHINHNSSNILIVLFFSTEFSKIKSFSHMYTFIFIKNYKFCFNRTNLYLKTIYE